MDNQLKQLIELQKIDSTILSKKRFLDKMPEKIREVELPLRQGEAVLQKYKITLDETEKKKRSKERELDDVTEKIHKMKSRATDIKTNKEYQAHLKEIKSVEKESSYIEDEILTIMEEIESLTQRMLEQEKIMNDVRKKVDVLKKEIDAEEEQSEMQMKESRVERAKIAETIDEEIYQQYISLIESRHGNAVIKAKNEICQGCNMNIPPQLFVEVKRNERIIHCPQCNRILYYQND